LFISKHKWESEYFAATTAYLLENSDLIRPVKIDKQTGFRAGGIGGGLERLSWQGEQQWFYEFADSMAFHQHHDIEVLPNGNVLILAWEYKSMEQAIEAGRLPNKISGALWPTLVVEVQPIGLNGGDIVWEWHLWDHLIQDIDSDKENYGTVANHPELLDINFLDGKPPQEDWLHCNSIEYVEDYNWIIISSKYLNELYVIDHSTTTEVATTHSGGRYNRGGDFLYRWGNPEAYKRGEGSDQQLFDQHDVTFVVATETEKAKLLLFNNGTSRPEGKYSTINSLILPIDENGFFIQNENGALNPPTFDWAYQSPDTFKLYSPNGSSAQRLPNGNTLVAEGNSGFFFELNSNDEIVWEYQNPISITGPLEQGTEISGRGITSTLASHRARKYSTNYPAFEGKDLSSQGPLERNPIENDCLISSLNNQFNYTRSIQIYPNPVKDHLSIISENNFKYQLFDMNAMLIQKGEISNSINIIHLVPGIYFIQLLNDEGLYNLKFLKQ